MERIDHVLGLKNVLYTQLYHQKPLDREEIYRQLMEPLHQNLEPKDFPISDLVEEKTYCVESGGIAGGECTTVATGWYKKSYDGGPCNAMHGSSSINLDDDDRSTVKRPNRRKTRSGLNIIDNDD